MFGDNEKVTHIKQTRSFQMQVCVTFLLPPGIKGLIAFLNSRQKKLFGSISLYYFNRDIQCITM